MLVIIVVGGECWVFPSPRLLDPVGLALPPPALPAPHPSRVGGPPEPSWMPPLLSWYHLVHGRNAA